MQIELSAQEVAFLTELLDKVNVSGLQNKTMIVLLMKKFIEAATVAEEDEDDTGV